MMSRAGNAGTDAARQNERYRLNKRPCLLGRYPASRSSVATAPYGRYVELDTVVFYKGAVSKNKVHGSLATAPVNQQKFP